MEGAVVEGRLDADDGVARQPAFLVGLVDALLHGRDVVLGDRAADDSIGKFIFAALRQGLHLQEDVPVLPVPAGLFPVLVFRFRRGGDGLAVGDFGGSQLHVHPELALHLLRRHGQVGLPHAAHYHLAGAQLAVDGERGVFFGEAGEGRPHLVHVGLGLGIDGLVENRLGEGDSGQLDGLVLGAERIAGIGDIELGHGADIPGADFDDRLLGLAAHHEELSDALGGVPGGVEYLRVGAYRAGVDAEIGEFAHVGVGGRLEDQCRQWPALAGLRLTLLQEYFPLPGGGQVIADGVQQPGRGHVRQRRAGQNGDDFTLDYRPAQRRGKLLRGDFLAAQVLLDEGIIYLGNRLHQLLAVAFGLGLECLWHVAFLGLGPGAGIGLHRQQVDDALEAGMGADSQLQRQAFLAQLGLDFPDDLDIIGVLAVHLVDEDEPWQTGLLAVAPDLLRADLHAGGGADDDDGPFADAQGGPGLADEIGIAGGVEDIELMIPPLAGQQ